MPQKIRYGDERVVSIDVPADALVANCDSARNRPLDDPAAAVAATLADPLGYPAFKHAVVPDDRVVIALDSGIPQVGSVLAGVVHTLRSAGIHASDITVLHPQTDRQDLRQHVLAGLTPEVAQDVQVVVHDPTLESDLSYLAARKDGQPIYLHRLLCDADVLLPIETTRVDSSLGYLGFHACLYPAFSDEKTQARFRIPHAMTGVLQQRRHREEANEVAWLLGIQFALQIIPGPGESILHAVAGQVDEIGRRSQRLCREAWSYNVPQAASLVIAAIEGRDQQNWENFGRALFAASRVCAESGTIVICTDLCCQPGPALQRLVGHRRSSDVQRILQKESSADAVSASLLIEACEDKHVYLLSGLAEQTVEDLGLGYVSDPKDINRLSRQFPSCILLADAHRTVPTTAS